MRMIGRTACALELAVCAPALDGGLAITEYCFEYRRERTSCWERISVAAAAQAECEVRITGLAAATAYVVRCCALNAKGCGPYLQADLATASTVPAQPPQPTPIDRTSDSVTLLFSAPEADGGEPISAYDVELSLGTGRGAAAVARLRPNGEALLSDAEPEPADAGGSASEAEWTVLAPGEYLIAEQRQQQEGNDAADVACTRAFVCTIAKLQPAQRLSVRIVAINANGRGEPSAPAEVVTAALAMASPLSLAPPTPKGGVSPVSLSSATSSPARGSRRPSAVSPSRPANPND
jgi:hypothetical protein